MIWTGASYFENLLIPENRKSAIDTAVATLTEWRKNNPFDAIAFRGMSGALIAPIIAYKMDLPLIVIRKENDDSHDHRKVFGFVDDVLFKYIILDDFIETGRTVAKIIEAVEKATQSTGKLVGVFAYNRYHESLLGDYSVFENATLDRDINYKFVTKYNHIKVMPLCSANNPAAEIAETLLERLSRQLSNYQRLPSEFPDQ